MENNKFSYKYSAAKTMEVEAIRKKYMSKEISKMEKLKYLDAVVQSAGVIESLTLGIIGVLIFGVAMCAGLGAIGGGVALAVLLGILGAFIMLTAYPLYRLIHKRKKEKLAPEILSLAEELMGK